MSDGIGAKRKRDASAEEFRLFLKRLDPVEEHAWGIHDTLRRKLIWFFARDFPLQAEELAEETLDRIAKKSDCPEIRNVTEFAFGVARNLRRETSRRSLIAARVAPYVAIHNSILKTDNPEQEAIHRIDFERKLACYKTCLKALDSEDRRLLAIYYPENGDDLEERREELAQELQTNLRALRTRVARLRERLEKCFGRCCGAPRSDPRNLHPKSE